MSRAVLVVEDTADLMLAARLLLEFAGYRVVTAASGEAALTALDREQPDVMLLDIRLPDMDAWEVLRRLRDRGGRPARIPVVICSAHTDPTIVAKAREFNCASYLTKPYRADTLVSAVDGVLRNRAPSGA